MNTQNTNKIADRESIETFFGLNELDAHNILMNLNFGFFATHFGVDADAKWIDAHPFFYPGNVYRDFSSFSLDFINKHFELFLNKQFFTSGGWELNPQTNRVEYVYHSGYINRK